MNNEKRQLLIKKLLYKSCNRGCKETDLVLGKFAHQNLRFLSDNELSEFEIILELPDIDIYDWYTGKKPLSAHLHTKLLQKILNFIP